MNKKIVLFMDKRDCCGCTACKVICPKNIIEMVEDVEGFVYPNINHELCIKCGRCIKVCPLHTECK